MGGGPPCRVHVHSSLVSDIDVARWRRDPLTISVRLAAVLPQHPPNVSPLIASWPQARSRPMPSLERWAAGRRHLDADLRSTMRSELARLRRELAVTTLCVTHDREDAAVLADRVIEMSAGRITSVSETGRREERA